MRRVLRNTSEVFHYWANQVQAEGKSGSVRFEGDTVYSYAQPIGRLFSAERVALLSDRKFSVTTTRHQSEAFRALPSGWRIVHAPVVSSLGDTPHRENRSMFERQFVDSCNQSEKYPRRTTLVHKANELRSQYARYSEAFKLNWPELSAEKLNARFEVEMREARARAEAKKAADEEQRKQRIAEQKENLAEWRIHEFACRSNYFEQTALRLSKDNKHIETSRGAQVPVTVATYLWPLACTCRRTKTEYYPQGDEHARIGNYTLAYVSPQGDLTIGCHHIPFDELALMAETLAFTPYSGEHSKGSAEIENQSVL